MQGILKALDNVNNIQCGVYNLGNSIPISLNKFIELCEKVTNKKAIFVVNNKQLGDIPHTYADISKAKRDLNYIPQFTLENGLKKTFEWIRGKD